MKAAARSLRVRDAAKPVLATCIALFVTATALVMSAAPAHADPVSIACSGTQTITYTPGVTDQPQEVTFGGGAEFTCTSTDPTITAGSYGSDGNATLQCTIGATSGVSVYKWNTSETSTVSWTTTVPLRPLGFVAVVFTATVTEGKYMGANLLGTLTLTPSGGPLDCFDSDGITHASGPINFELVAP